MKASVIGRRGARYAAAVAAAVLLGSGGCNLEKKGDAPLLGPSETGISVQLIAIPDVVNADGVSRAVVELRLRDQDGAPAPGRAVEFTFNGDGGLFPAAESIYVGPIQTGIVMATDEAGVARVVWVAGFQIRTITVFVRPYGIDSANHFFQSVEIIQR